jgi:hypothetical protein
MGFSYIESEDTVANTAAALRALRLPFGTYVDPVAGNGTPAVPATTSLGQCNAVDVNLYPYLAFGGAPPVTYSVSLTQGEGEDAVAYETGHGFMIDVDDGMTMLSGRQNVPSGDYIWTLNADDAASQHDERSWRLRVTDEDYRAPAGASNDAELRITSLTGVDWPDFISSIQANPLIEFGTTGGADQVAVTSPDGATTTTAVKALDLDGTDGQGSIVGSIGEEDGIDGADDADVFWLGGLTPDYVLHVKVKGDSELPTGLFNDVNVKLYPYVVGEEKQAAVPPATSDMTGYEAYKDIDCGFYYLEVTGTYELASGIDATRKVNRYTLSWMFEDKDEDD